MLSANDKLIKLWRIEYKKEKKYESCKKLLQKGKLMIPRSKVINESWEGCMRRQYRNAHEYHINSLSLACDGEHFLSADDLRINIWSIENNQTVYNVLDIKPKNIDELDEVVSHCEFNPLQPPLFLYTTSKGFLHICDFRDQSTFQNSSSMKYEIGHGQKKNLFSDLINSLSSAKFFKKYPHLVASRDYLSIKLWDLRSTSQTPLMQCHTCDYLEKSLCNLYEEESIYDKFFMDISPCSNYILTGGYSKSGHIIDLNMTTNVTIQTNFDAKRGKIAGKARKYNSNKKLGPLDSSEPDFKKKVMNGTWHPSETMAALAFRNCIFLYYHKNK